MLPGKACGPDRLFGFRLGESVDLDGGPASL
jgi:hypothetical protein